MKNTLADWALSGLVGNAASAAAAAIVALVALRAVHSRRASFLGQRGNVASKIAISSAKILERDDLRFDHDVVSTAEIEGVVLIASALSSPSNTALRRWAPSVVARSGQRAPSVVVSGKTPPPSLADFGLRPLVCIGGPINNEYVQLIVGVGVADDDTTRSIRFVGDPRSEMSAAFEVRTGPDWSKLVVSFPRAGGESWALIVRVSFNDTAVLCIAGLTAMDTLAGCKYFAGAVSRQAKDWRRAGRPRVWVTALSTWGDRPVVVARQLPLSDDWISSYSPGGRASTSTN